MNLKVFRKIPLYSIYSPKNRYFLCNQENNPVISTPAFYIASKMALFNAFTKIKKRKIRTGVKAYSYSTWGAAQKKKRRQAKPPYLIGPDNRFAG